QVSARAVDRNSAFSLGVHSGSYVSGYENGEGYSDFGLGLSLGYRPVETLGLELSWEHHSETFDTTTERIAEPLQASVELYAFPWARVSPYVLGGLTWTSRSVRDSWSDGQTQRITDVEDTLFGPHAGLGLEFAIGEQASLEMEGRLVNYLNVADTDASLPAAAQGTIGLNMYF
ncbi:MAG: outer membrane beta-barrel protein, partial [Myxococcota bacterium]|nr:outer membrane beta-barrel protein [Myxococcota bacterium]